MDEVSVLLKNQSDILSRLKDNIKQLEMGLKAIKKVEALNKKSLTVPDPLLIAPEVKKTTEKASKKASEKASEKAPEKAPEKASEKAPEKKQRKKKEKTNETSV